MQKTTQNKGNNIAPVGAKDKYGNGYWNFKKSGKENAETYLDLCYKNKLIPVFSQFLDKDEKGHYHLKEDGSTDGYWKLLIDFKMYDNEGNGSPQTTVVPNVNMAEAYRVLNDYKLERKQPGKDTAPAVMKDNNSLPVAQPVVDRYVEEYKVQHPLDENRTKYSLPIREVEEYAEKAFPNTKARTPDGKLMPLYHGTSADFTVFDTSVSGGKNGVQEGYGIYLTDNPEIPKQYGGRTISAYVDMERPAYADKKTFKRSELAKVIKAACEKEAQQFVDEGSYDNVKDAVGDTWISNYVYTPEYRTIDEAYRAVADLILGQNDNDSDIIGELLIGQGIRDYGRAMDFYHNILTPLTGFDGIWAKWNNRDTGEISNVLLAFDSSQIKSNEDVTYDNQGNPIPMGQRFDRSNPDIRYSIPSDAPYLSAVNHGEIEQAQQYVDEAARNAGYNLEIFHGTGEYFNVFNRGYEGIHLGNREQAEQVANMRYEHRSKMSNYKWNDIKDSVKDMNAEQRESLVRSAYFVQDYFNDGQSVPEFDGDINDTDAVTAYVDGILKRYEAATNDEAGVRMRTFDRETNKNVMRLYAKISNPFVINGDIGEWTPTAIAGVILKRADGETTIPYYGGDESRGNTIDISGSDFELTDDQRADLEKLNMMEINGYDNKWDALSDVLNRMGFDGIKYLNTYEGDQNSYSYIALKQSDVKSADPVTYDDEGNLIPLSERFNEEQNDIRYSLPSENLLNQQIRQYMERGGSLMEDENLPGNPLPEEGGSAQRQFGRRTAQTSDALHQEVKDYLYTHSSYTPDSNQAQIDRAMDWVQSRATADDPDGYQAAVNEVTSDSFDYRSADGQARMLTVMGMSALKNDLNTELRLADAYNKQGTDLGRQLQARKIFRLMTPIGRQATLQRMADQINDQYAKEGKTTRVKLSDWTLLAAGEAQTEEEFQRVQHAASQELAEQMPANWKDKLRGWRMLSMLGNLRTHIRNFVGNALFVPAVSMKNKLGAVMELGMEKGQRTKTLAPILSKEVRDFAKQDALTMKDTLTGEAKYNENSMVEREQKPFKGLLQAIIDFNSDRLEKEDWTFLKGHYKRALGGWMQANGYTAADMENNPALLEKGRSYAVQEAQKATYRDFNKLAATLNQVSRNGGVTGFLVDAVLPFKKTPANILKRGIEYSPIGIMKSLTTDLYHLKQWNDYKSGKLSALPDKAISPNQFIDDLCSGLTGTAVMAVGALLGHAGIVTCGLDDDDDKNEKEQGNQKYSIKFSIAGHDYTYTVDWAAPMAMPFFVGAAIQEQMANQEGFDIEQLINAFGNITEPVFNLSMLDGVNTLFKTSQYDDTNTITQIGAKIASNYATSYIPSLLGAIARTVDDKSRKSFVEQGKGTGVLGTLRYAWEQAENKIPGLSQTNIPIRDIWGNEKTSSLAERIFENFISPGYIEEYKNDPVLKEMANLYELTGNTDMIPKSDPNKTITYKNEKHVLSAEQWDQYKANRNQTAYKMLKELINDPGYQNATDPNVQAQMIDKVWDYADDVGKKAVFPDYELKQNPNIIKSVVHDGNVSAYNANMLKSLESGDYEGYETMIEALHQEGVEDSKIKEKIGDKYRDQYKDAYKKGDWERMSEIEALLDKTGFDFDLDAWEEQVNKKRGN